MHVVDISMRYNKIIEIQKIECSKHTYHADVLCLSFRVILFKVQKINGAKTE